MEKLCYPRVGCHIAPSFLPNHKSWEADEVKEKLWKIIVMFSIFKGALEYVAAWHPLPTPIEPKGTVPNKGQDLFWDIADACLGNTTLLDWGTRLFSKVDLARELTSHFS